jgi:hypothetical protein
MFHLFTAEAKHLDVRIDRRTGELVVGEETSVQLAPDF